MPVDKFGRTDTTNSTRVVSGGVTLSQIKNTFLQRDGVNAATGDINLDSHKLINVRNPDNAQDVVTKTYCDSKDIEIKNEIKTYVDGRTAEALINVENLLKVANILTIYLPSTHEPYFSTKHRYVQGLYNAIVTLFKEGGNGIDVLKQFEGLPFVKDLKIAIMRVILDLSENDFIKLKGGLLIIGYLMF